MDDRTISNLRDKLSIRVKPKPRQWFAVIDKAGRFDPILFETRADADKHASKTRAGEIVLVEEKL